MDDLISRRAAIKFAIEQKIKETGAYSKGRNTAFLIMKSALNNPDVIPPAPAVPLDKLCEWLGKFANPCKIGIRCYYPDDNNEDCMPTVECWRYVLTKWMEEQDAQTDKPGK